MTTYKFQAIGTNKAGQLVEITGNIEGESGFPQSVREDVAAFCQERHGVTVSLAELGSIQLRDCRLEQRREQLQRMIGRDRRDE